MDQRKGEDKRNKKKSKNKHITEQPNICEDYEQEIICDGEMDMQETDCVEVEVADETSQPVFEPSPKASTSKAARSSKVNTPKQNTILSPSPSSSTLNLNSSKKGPKKRRDSSTSSEEERWLTAIESGKLEDVDDELKKMKDPKLMTARQRAMYERNLDREPDSPGGVELLMSLPIGYREKEKPQTAEDIQKAALKIQKRKQLADEKREKDKKKTVDRLLKKQESNKQRAAARNKAAAATKMLVPMISYRNTPEGAYIHLPADLQFPIKAQAAREPPTVQLCGIAGCNKPKIYNCSKTNIPLCSFACYRKNVLSLRQIIC